MLKRVGIGLSHARSKVYIHIITARYDCGQLDSFLGEALHKGKEYPASDFKLSQ